MPLDADVGFDAHDWGRSSHEFAAPFTVGDGAMIVHILSTWLGVAEGCSAGFLATRFRVSVRGPVIDL